MQKIIDNIKKLSYSIIIWIIILIAIAISIFEIKTLFIIHLYFVKLFLISKYLFS